jgi:hypothetical protein
MLDMAPFQMVVGLDASGKEDNQPALAVAGFVSSATDWEEFTIRWKGRLEADGIAYFRAADFAQSVKEFAHLKGDEQRRRRLSRDLMDILKTYVYRKFGCIVVCKDFKGAVGQDINSVFFPNAYVLAGIATAADVSIWARREQLKTPYRIVFEDGDEGKGALVERMVTTGLGAPTFEPKRDKLDANGNLVPGFVPLQAADWLAYETFLDFKAARGFSKPRPIRWAAEEFSKMVGGVDIMEPDNLSQLLIMLKRDLLSRVRLSIENKKGSQE